MSELYNLKKGAPLGWIEQRLQYTDFVQVGGTATKAEASLGAEIPAGAHVLLSQVRVAEGFTGDTTAVITLGDGTDVDRYNTSTINVLAASEAATTGVPSGVTAHSAAVTPTVTLTGAADTDDITAGDMTIRITFLAGL